MPRKWYYYIGDYIGDAPGPLNVGPFTSREEAALAAFDKHPDLKSVFTGYGSDGAYFDIRWLQNPNWKPPEE